MKIQGLIVGKEHNTRLTYSQSPLLFHPHFDVAKSEWPGPHTVPIILHCTNLCLGLALPMRMRADCYNSAFKGQQLFVLTEESEPIR